MPMVGVGAQPPNSERYVYGVVLSSLPLVSYASTSTFSVCRAAARANRRKYGYVASMHSGAVTAVEPGGSVSAERSPAPAMCQGSLSWTTVAPPVSVQPEAPPSRPACSTGVYSEPSPKERKLCARSPPGVQSYGLASVLA